MHAALYGFLFILVLAIPTVANGQEIGPIQVSGVVLEGDSLKALPYTSILIKNSKTGTISDNSGYFSMFVGTGDTVQFSSVGYKTAQFVLPRLLHTSNYSLIQLMQKDTILLEQVTVKPWPDLEDLVQAFLDPETEGSQSAKTNKMQKELRATLSQQTELDKAYYTQMRYSKLYQTTGIVPPNNLLNPFTWANFIRDWRKVAFKNKGGYLPRPIKEGASIDDHQR